MFLGLVLGNGREKSLKKCRYEISNEEIVFWKDVCESYSDRSEVPGLLSTQLLHAIQVGC